ncbi:hypothetical protein ACRAWG_35150 [Methylobacterium sp. P31]
MSVLGKWRIVEPPGYADDYADMVELAYILFEAARGTFAFGCVTGAFVSGGDHAAIEFDWSGNDEMDAACGSGWAELQADGSLQGGIGFHAGDEIPFIARRWSTSSTAC